MLAVREGRVFTAPLGRPGFGVTYTVTAYAVGAQVAQASSGQDIAVQPGHGFTTIGQKMIVGTGPTAIDRYRVIDQTPTATNIHVSQAVSVSAGELIVNLGADGGTTAPLYNASPIDIFRDMGGASIFTNSSLQTGEDGFYRYWTAASNNVWELVRTSTGQPFSIVTDTEHSGGENRVAYEIRYAHLFATGGTGTASDPWVTAGSNPVRAALDDLPITGGVVMKVAGHFDLGSDAVAVNIPILTDTLDKRAYSFIGAGRDLTFEHYSGTGSAYRYAGVNTGSPGNSLQSNQIVLKGFALQQTGTARTGNGFYGTYISESRFEDLCVGSVRQDRQTGEPDNGFAFGLRFEGTPGDNVTDFNRVDNCYFQGNTTAIYGQNQNDNMVIERCSFEPRQDASVAQDGVWIHNSGGITVRGNHFNFFHFNSASFGLKISGSSNGNVVQGNYFERNSTSIYLFTDGHQGGNSISGNQISFANGDGGSLVGIRAGVDSGTWQLSGTHIHGNAFFVMGATNTGVRIGSDCRGYVLGPNRYDNAGGTNAVYTVGCRGVTLDVDTNGFPIIGLRDNVESAGRVQLINTSGGGVSSPRIEFTPGPGSGSLMGIGVSASGHFQALDASGVAKMDIDQSGNYTQYPLGPANATQWIRGSATELVTLAAAAFTDSTIDLPANSIIESVVGRVVTVIPTAATFTVGDPTITTRFAAGVAVAATTTFVGLTHIDLTGTSGPRQTTASKVRITPNLTPATATGQVRIVIYYRKLVAPSA